MGRSRTGWKPAASWQRGFTLAGLLMAFALLDGVHTHLGFIAEGNPRPWWNTLIATAIFWLIYAAFIPPVLFVAERYRLDLRPRTILIHLLAAFAFTYIHILAVSYLMAPLRAAPVEVVPLLGRLVRLNFGINFLSYWAIVGATHALRYRGESRQSELAAAQLEASLTASRLEALRAQLNPHFLFNTLNAISVLALKGQHTAVIDTLSRLSDLLRVSLDDTRPHRVPLSEELDFLDGYLKILQLRFGDRLVVEQRITREVLDALVPCMILQPVVENAIVHGIAARCGEGRISIEAARTNDTLHLQIQDNGPGFGTSTTRGHGIGLRNTRARLEQIYGRGHSLELSDAAEGGAIVTISIPFVVGELAIPA